MIKETHNVCCAICQKIEVVQKITHDVPNSSVDLFTYRCDKHTVDPKSIETLDRFKLVSEYKS